MASATDRQLREVFLKAVRAVVDCQIGGYITDKQAESLLLLLVAHYVGHRIEDLANFYVA